jgi:hypothetical protein
MLLQQSSYGVAEDYSITSSVVCRNGCGAVIADELLIALLSRGSMWSSAHPDRSVHSWDTDTTPPRELHHGHHGEQPIPHLTHHRHYLVPHHPAHLLPN